MDAEGTHIGSSFAADPENAHIALFVVLNQLGLIDSPNAKLLLDGGDERRPLEASTFEGVQRFLELLHLIKALM